METVLEKNLSSIIRAGFEAQQKRSIQLRTASIQERKKKLRALKSWILNNLEQLKQAAFKDMSKPSVEFEAIEILYVLNEIKSALNCLDSWVKPRLVDAPLDMLGTRSWICYEPKGVCLIISPWNYAFSLCVGPLISALAAGNTAILKPSELTPHTSNEIARMANELFDPSEVSVFEGDAEVSKTLLELPFDHIFFTGSPSIGKIVMKAAADNLASVTLELGGKCPAIVTNTAKIDEAAERIAVSKFVNNGQTCVAPDYVVVDKSIYKVFVERLTHKIKQHFTETNQAFVQSPHYARIVGSKHFHFLQDLMKDAVERGATVSFTGEHQPSSNFFHPTILTNISPESRIMQEEIFGPILPVLTYSELSEAIDLIHGIPKPLGLYIFSHNRNEQQRIIRETSSGGVCLNECAIQFLHHRLPFGGVNNSGIGKAHHYAGFLTFSNEKPVLKQKSGFTSVKAFYPPYTEKKRKLMNWLLKLFYR